MEKVLRYAFTGCIMVVAFAIVIVGTGFLNYWAFGHIVMWAWNISLTPMLGWHPITLWQSIGLNVLLDVIVISFKGLGIGKLIDSYKDRKKMP